MDIIGKKENPYDHKVKVYVLLFIHYQVISIFCTTHILKHKDTHTGLQFFYKYKLYFFKNRSRLTEKLQSTENFYTP